VQVKLSQYYDKLNTEVDFSAIELYLHAFSDKALDGDVPLTSNKIQTKAAVIIRSTNGCINSPKMASIWRSIEWASNRKSKI